MAVVNVKVSKSALAKADKRLAGLLKKTSNLQPAMDQAAEYMVRSTKNRILRQKVAPDGTPWAPLTQLTVELKGHDSILFESGKLANSIKVEDVSKSGFMVRADAEHASHMQKGVRRTNGRYPNQRIPARPFMGFSAENTKRIVKIIRDYIADN